MPNFQELLYRVALRATGGDLAATAIQSIVFDSRKVSPGCLFVAIKGTQADGHVFIEQAIAQGAAAIVCQEMPAHLQEAIPFAVVAHSGHALGVIASNFYGNPSSKLQVVGVTGTNGKTTVATLLFRLFRKLGYNTGLLSTVQNQLNEEVIPSTHTTPDALAISAFMARMVKEGYTHCFMEVSSHALDQGRVAGITFTGAIFTNITHDHLDYHGTFANYLAAKKRLFDMLPGEAWALTNLDDRNGRVMLQNTKARQLTYSLRQVADFKTRIVGNTLQGLQLEIGGQEAWFKLVGEFNASNLTAVYAAATQLGEEPEQVLACLTAIPSVDGRFDWFTSTKGVTVIVDYAHTPDALENVLKTITDLRTRNETVYTLVGCGGDRDAAKRPIMAQVATKLSDRVILTSDNPRSEDPDAIIAEMRKGVPASKYNRVTFEVDRAKAIALVAEQAQAGDVVLIAGKGHETYQEIKGVKHPFDDRAIARQAFGEAGM